MVIVFRIVGKFEEKVNMEVLATHYVGSPPSNQLLQLFEQVNALKKNPMTLKLDLTLQGLILRLSLEYDLLDRIMKLYKEYSVKIKGIRGSVIPVPTGEGDMKTLSVTVDDLAVDYWPQLR